MMPKIVVGWSIALIFFSLGILEAATRKYYIAAEDVVWDYAPSGHNLVCPGRSTAPCPLPEPWRDRHIFNKVRYIQYRDASFSEPVQQPSWLGVLGPIIRAEVGDTVLAHFCNRSTRGAYGMHPHGLRYDKTNEGGHYFGVQHGTPPGAGSQVQPGNCFDYVWLADSDSGPEQGEVSSKVWWYHSHVNEPAETNAGLLGPIIVTAQGMARADGSPKDVNLEFVTAFFIFDELNGEEAGLMHAINGYIFGNLPGLVAPYGSTVRWHVIGMGNEVDLHTPHWHGKTVRIGARHVARRTDVVQLLPAAMITADMKADNPGEWLFHCHVSDHIKAGMSTTFQITEANGKQRKR